MSLINSPIKKVKKIVLENGEGYQEECSGGYFIVKCFQANIIENLKSGTTIEEDSIIYYPKNIAIKKLRKEFELHPKHSNKVQHEKEIVRQIRNKAHVCAYYEAE